MREIRYRTVLRGWAFCPEQRFDRLNTSFDIGSRFFNRFIFQADLRPRQRLADAERQLHDHQQQ